MVRNILTGWHTQNSAASAGGTYLVITICYMPTQPTTIPQIGPILLSSIVYRIAE